jgi:hypothetical protein
VISDLKSAKARLAAFVIAELPDSLKARKQVLDDLLSIVPVGPLRAEIYAMIAMLETLEEKQISLPLQFAPKGETR